jgi:hypothetical protein
VSFTIAINLPSDLRRVCSYWTNAEQEQEPAMFIFREGQFGRSAMIALSSAWHYDEPHKKTQEQLAETFRVVTGMMRCLGVELTREMIHRFLMYIQDGLEELVRMPPAPVKRTVVGEAEVWVEGQKRSSDISIENRA